MIAKVVLDLTNRQCNRLFDYLVPQEIECFIKPGCRVFVPFGARKILGIVIDLTSIESNYELKPIIELIDFEPVLSSELLALGQELSTYYFSFLSQTYLMMLPQALKVSYPKLVQIKDKNLLSQAFLEKLNGKNEILLDEILSFKDEIIRLKKQNAINITNLYKEKGKVKTIKYVILVNPLLAKTKKQKEIVAYFEEANMPLSLSFLTNEVGYSSATIKTLVNNQVLSILEKESYREVMVNEIKNDSHILNTYQKNAYDTIKNSKGFTKFLLHGVCGSGKTEVYLHLINDIVNQGKTALMLVPEISLSSQLSSRVKARFGNLVAILHSRLSNGEKFDEWRRIKKNEAKIVVGARSALFAPLKNLGIIIMDEEQESSYIQDTNPRYDSHFVALFRAKYNQIPLVFGSATPSIKTYYKALNKDIILLDIPIRANNKKQPNSIIVDMRQELLENNRSVLSRELQLSLRKTLQNNEQAILLINRRGYSTFVMCRSCGKSINCPHCDVSLTIHKYNNNLVCHYCGYQTISPTKCPSCSSPYIRFVGDGTQKVEEEIKFLFPEARLLRMDSDTTKGKNGHNDLIAKFQNHEADILLGTQVVAKGLDFPNVSLVGIVNADLGLKMPFYDAYEKSFDLLEQSSGRAGRHDTNSKVIIQTYNPENEVIRFAAVHDYKNFYKQEILRRELQKTPPFMEVIELQISSSDSLKAQQCAIQIIKYLKKEVKDCIILGPVKHFIFKMKDMYYYDITLKMNETNSLPVLNYLNEHYQNEKDLYLSIKRS